MHYPLYCCCGGVDVHVSPNLIQYNIIFILNYYNSLDF